MARRGGTTRAVRAGRHWAPVLLAVALTPMPAAALPSPETPWIPGNAGVMWTSTSPGLPAQPPGQASWWLTRRIVTSPFAPEVQHMGSLLHGLYTSVSGGAWVSLTPGCLLPEQPPTDEPNPAYGLARDLAIALSGLSSCGVEGLAYDPLVPGRMYASTYSVSTVSGAGATIGNGGVYVSDDLGAHWRELLGGVRGNGLAVGRPGLLSATIVAGWIQRTNGDVGSTPGDGSLSVSGDGGATWRHVSLPESGCGSGVETSQRITPTIVFNPADARVVYAGTNAGLYVSSDSGSSWSLARQACGGIWGIAVGRDESRVYIGDYLGRELAGTKEATGFTQLTDLGSGKVQSLQLDPIDEARVYAAVWDGGDAGIYRIDTRSGGSRRLGDSLLAALDQSAPSEIPRPFPLTPAAGNNAPSLFLAHPPGRLEVSTILRGMFWRAE